MRLLSEFSFLISASFLSDIFFRVILLWSLWVIVIPFSIVRSSIVYRQWFRRHEKRRKGAVMYHKHAGLCLEPQYFPDAVHHSHFPSIILRPGEAFRQLTVHRFYSCISFSTLYLRSILLRSSPFLTSFL